jgi:peptidoglycan-associated lipoprotein
MKMRKILLAALGTALCVSMIGCSHNAKKGHGKNGDASTYGAAGQNGYGENEGDLLSKRKIYFDYDQATLHHEDMDVVAAHAQFLKANPGRHIRVEGHTDEQGSREYNVGLGEKRAKAVVHGLTSNGVSRSQISTVSFGKEKPDDMGHSDESHRLNRRAVIVYED